MHIQDDPLRAPLRGLLSFTLAACSAAAPAAAQTWQRQFPATFPALLDVATDGNGLVVAVGDDGQVLRSTDAGATWSPTTVTPGTPAGRLAAVEFCGSVLLAGGDGLYQSVDGGVTWSLADTTTQIEDIETLAPSHAWAFTSDGTVLRSTDAGATWATSLLPAGTFFGLGQAIAFEDTQSGWVSSRNGQMYETTDGGLTWSTFTSPTNWTVYGLQRSASLSYMLEDDQVWRWNGAGWTYSHFPWTSNARDFHIVGSFGLTVGLSGRIHVSPNAGGNWLLSLEDNGFEHEGVVILDSMTAVVVGEQGRVLRTTDAANSWNVVHGGGGTPNNYWIYGMHAPDTDTVFAACNSGVILRSDDGGGTWTQQDGGTAQTHFRAVHFFDDQNGYAVGEKQGFYPTFSSTHDGGLNWYEVNHLGMYDIFDVVATGPMTASAASETRIWYTTNGGQSWSSHTPTPYGTYRAIEFRGQVGWAAGTQMVKTTDGGASWSWIYDPGPTIHGLAFTDAQRGWAVGSSGAILRTTDGGTTWSPQTSGVTATLRTISAFSNDIAIAAGEQGVVLLTTDAGGTWSPFPPAGLSTDNVTCSASGTNTIWIGGEGAAGIWRLLSGSSSCVTENYCVGKVHSGGGIAAMRLFGAPSVANGVIGVGVIGALPNTVGLGFRSDVGAASSPLWNGTLCVQPPLTRLPVLTFDVNGFAYYNVQMNASLVGTSQWYQVLFRDVAHPDGTGISMTDGLHLTFCP